MLSVVCAIKSARCSTLYCIVIILRKCLPSLYTSIIYEQWCLSVYYTVVILSTIAFVSLPNYVKKYIWSQLSIKYNFQVEVQQASLGYNYHQLAICYYCILASCRTVMKKSNNLTPQFYNVVLHAHRVHMYGYPSLSWRRKFTRAL